MNKPRLIDANELIELIEKNCYNLTDRINSVGKGMFIDGIKQAIYMQPTAYDIDKVVEQLENLKQHEQEQHAYATVWGIEQSIEIVKGGADNA